MDFASCGLKSVGTASWEKVFDVIEAEPHRLREVNGIGPVMRAARIAAAWAEQKAVREELTLMTVHRPQATRASLLPCGRTFGFRHGLPESDEPCRRKDRRPSGRQRLLVPCEWPRPMRGISYVAAG